jgi:hypothetical protein
MWNGTIPPCSPELASLAHTTEALPELAVLFFDLVQPWASQSLSAGIHLKVLNDI